MARVPNSSFYPSLPGGNIARALRTPLDGPDRVRESPLVKSCRPSGLQDLAFVGRIPDADRGRLTLVAEDADGRRIESEQASRFRLQPAPGCSIAERRFSIASCPPIRLGATSRATQHRQRGLSRSSPSLRPLGILPRPVFFGDQGTYLRTYEIDAFEPTNGIALEVEAGRATMGNAVYRDLIQASLMLDARFLALAVPVEYRYKSGARTAREPSYAKTYSVVEALYGSPRLNLPFEGLLLIGY